ncbi:hypothetical protein B0T18DRAFT_437105 [Schizothecium vesticola]|uniref:Uncharacterized protein n=1 Tax=Schizothecium vesticola TaxID=314040 RepID=A0AA40F1U4_9PEZI|nr:hypothetical protein B0T18DRAFT_437105 [Schizothecium vesticola]
MFPHRLAGSDGLSQSRLRPENLSFSSRVAVPELNRQPVYTTVGSIYNPSKTSAIQAPTRRPRPRRYPTAFPVPAGAEAYTDAPGSLLAALSLKDREYNLSPAPRPRTPQYSPLQQNLDRAVSPRLITKRASPGFLELGMSIPSIRSGNLPPPSTLGFNVDTIDWQSGAAFGDTDSVASEETLSSSRIGVKGLANLASYPNPMQKAAQNKLARARIANIGLQSASTSSSLHTASEHGNGGGLGSGTGAPRPLTAGPPGQRHFRPATFDSTSRTAKVEETDIAQRVSTLDHIDVLEALSTLRAEGPPSKSHSTANNRLPVNDYTGSAAARDSSRPSPHMAHSVAEAVLAPQAVVAQPPIPAEAKSDLETRNWSAGDGRSWVTRDTLPVSDIGKYYPRGLAKDYIAVSQQSESDASDPKLELSRRFYADTEGLVRNTNRVVREHDVRCPKNRLGVIGEGRSRRQREVSDRVRPEFIDVQEANRMEDSLHAEPLLNMMLETLLRYQEGARPSNSTSMGLPTVFVPADPAWVDDSQGGNKSFFEQRQAEKPTRESSSRRTRRRY